MARHPARHQVTRDSMLDTRREDGALQGVVLLDLPDHDSTEVAHHLEVDRLVQLADMLVWVLDPQKYADAAIHDRYLAPLATHQDVMVVVLNHVDRVPEERRAAMLADVRRLLDADGLDRVPVIAASAREGWGLDELRERIGAQVKSKKATRERLEADLQAAARRLGTAAGDGRPRDLGAPRVVELRDALADSAGVPTVVDAVQTATRVRAGRATGWPLVSWVSRLRPDPLKRLHLDLGSSGRELTGRARTSVPEATGVQRARVDAAVRAVADDAVGEVRGPFADAVRRASVSRVPELGDRLDAAVAGTDLGVARLPWWAGALRVVQWALLLTALVGAAWLGALAAAGFLQLDLPDAPSYSGLPAPTALLLGGVAAGILLALLARVLVSLTARARARSADQRLRSAIADVADELVVHPIQAEVAAYRELRAEVARITG